MRTSCIALVIWLGLTASLFAQDWAKAMFNGKTSHNFGTVARGAKVEYKFEIENLYEEDVHISAVYPSCECVSPKIEKRTLKSLEKAQLTAVLNTRSFYGQRDVTITVKFDAPFPAEVQIQVHGYIRSDVVVSPDVIRFGTVKIGSALNQQVNLRYAGRSDWQILRVESANPALQGHVVETSRTGNQVSYDLIATLNEKAPAGYIQDNLFLVTNDRDTRSARIPIPVEAIVAAPLTVRPNPMPLIMVQQGKSIGKPLFVQSMSATSQPFRILSVESTDSRFQVELPTEAKPRHLLQVMFTGSDEPGRFSTKLRIQTDLPDTQPVEVPIDVQVTP